jgi:hypothetical protein
MCFDSLSGVYKVLSLNGLSIALSFAMSGTLQPPYPVVCTIKTSIAATLATDLPMDVKSVVIAPLLSQVNQWSTQLATILDTPGPPLQVNLIFAIRKDLFGGPYFSQSVLGIPIIELPPPFQEFLSMVAKLVELQKPDREKPLPKVRSFPLHFPSFHLRFFL